MKFPTGKKIFYHPRVKKIKLHALAAKEAQRDLELQAQGKTPYSIGKELSAWVEKLFETSIPAETIRTQARRVKGTLNYKKSHPGQMTTPPITSSIPSEIPEKQDNQEVMELGSNEPKPENP